MTVTLNERFAIEPSDYRCVQCAAEVAVEAPFFSAIFFEGEAFRRRSYCTGCWPATAEPGGSEAYAFWRSRRPAPEAPPRRVRFDPDLVLEFFRRLGPGGAPAGAEASPSPEPAGDGNLPQGAVGQQTRLRLVLALLLVRRKALVFQSSGTREGREWLKLTEKAHPERTHFVENPPQSDAELEEVKASLGNLLQMDL